VTEPVVASAVLVPVHAAVIVTVSLLIGQTKVLVQAPSASVAAQAVADSVTGFPDVVVTENPHGSPEIGGPLMLSVREPASARVPGSVMMALTVTVCPGFAA
jgi:hypothetical protein